MTSADPDQMACVYWLIWIYTGHRHVKMCIKLRERVKYKGTIRGLRVYIGNNVNVVWFSEFMKATQGHYSRNNVEMVNFCFNSPIIWK